MLIQVYFSHLQQQLYNRLATWLNGYVFMFLNHYAVLHFKPIWYTIKDNMITMHLTAKVIDYSSDPINIKKAAKMLNKVDTITLRDFDSEKVLKEMGVLYEIIFVDDGSQDGTLEVLRKEAATNSNIRYIIFSFRHKVL